MWRRGEDRGSLWGRVRGGGRRCSTRPYRQGRGWMAGAPGLHRAAQSSSPLPLIEIKSAICCIYPPHPTHPPSLPSAPACCSASRRRTAACHSSQACCPYCRRASRCTTAVGGLVPSAFTQLASPGAALSRAREPRGAQHRRRLQGTERPQNNDLVLKSVSTSFFSTSFLPAGLLPILKELVEVLFQEQLVKVGDSVGWCLLVMAW